MRYPSILFISVVLLWKHVKSEAKGLVKVSPYNLKKSVIG